jgi:16S rRNA (guanine527-N7)-methyltransferase
LRDRPNTIKDIDPVEGKRFLEQGAKTLGISLSADQLEQFMDYLALLRKWNRVINLTALNSMEEIVVKHFLDSLTLLPHLPEKARILDLGSGAGFPGLPIKIVRPGQAITLVDASAKKISFLKEVVRCLNLSGTRVLQGFVSKRSPTLLGSDRFEIIVARAVGKLIDLLSGLYPYLEKGGELLLMKGREGPQEIFILKDEIGKRGFRIEAPIDLTLPFLEQERILIFLTKI